MLARSRYKIDRSHEFIPGYKVGGGHWRSVAPKALTEAQQASGVQIFLLWVDARVRVQQPLQICLRCRSKSKNRDKQLTHIVRVIGCCYYFFFLAVIKD
jgi:UDP-N-acetyl-D-mannosaminuronate dehydrogenase